MLIKGKIANEFGEIIGAYWYDGASCSYVLRVFNYNRYGYTEQGIIDWCNHCDCQIWED